MNLVTVDWLSNNLDNPHMVLLDATYPPIGKTWDDFADAGHIANSLRFDIDDFSLPSSGLPHTLLPPQLFQEKVRTLGINRDSVIVIYDAIGIYSAPRAWWNFKLMGHETVFVLDGGLPAWLAADKPVVTSCSTANTNGNFIANFNENYVVSTADLLAALDDRQTCIVDVRSPGRFRGEEVEPRPGVKSGHIPSSRNIPFAHLVNGIYLQPQEKLKGIFCSNGCKQNRRLIVSCGSGVTACIGLLAAQECGFTDVALYDGSWAEWGSAADLPIEKG